MKKSSQVLISKEEGFHVITLISILFVHIFAFLGLFYLNWQNLLALFFFNILTIGLGFSLGYHRLICHRTYNASKIFKVFATYMGALCLQGGPITFSNHHRQHHRFSDQASDPHSAQRGFLWSYFFWFLHKRPNGYDFSLNKRYDHETDSVYRFFEKYYLSINGASLLLFLVVFGWKVTLVLFPLRIVIGWHTAIWPMASLTHKLFPDGTSRPRNLKWLSFLTYGEGNHKTHHDHPTLLNLGHFNRDVDIGYKILLLFKKLQLVFFKEPTR